ncbi:hypothetical protein [Methylobacter sp.]|uniref:hypothetical protein n=1 Tax=Methylobacter sp. TaxID=2051955 RepID=UPI002FDE9A41
MLQEQIINEIKQIPSEKLAEVYDLIHYFRLGLKHEANALPKQRPIGLAKEIFQTPDSFFEPLQDEVLDAFEGK